MCRTYIPVVLENTFKGFCFTLLIKAECYTKNYLMDR